MRYKKLKAIAKREGKILRTKTGIQGKRLWKSTKVQSKKIKKNLPKLRKKASQIGMDIEDYFREGINPRNFKI